jgi:predicted porin
LTSPLDGIQHDSGWKHRQRRPVRFARLGFKGSEDLGGGLKAFHVLEYMLMPDVNAGFAGDWSGTATRQAFVGLKGNWGTVVVGRLQGAGYNFACTTTRLPVPP